jgi:hypothetical protein
MDVQFPTILNEKPHCVSDLAQHPQASTPHPNSHGLSLGLSSDEEPNLGLSINRFTESRTAYRLYRICTGGRADHTQLGLLSAL